MPNGIIGGADDRIAAAQNNNPNAITGPNMPGQDMAPLTGWARGRGYNPTELNAIWDSPWAILPDVFKGINQSGGPGYQALRDFGADPLTLYNIMVGGGTNFQGASGNPQGNYANWLQQLYSNLGSQGGAGFNAGNLLRQLFNPDVSSTMNQYGQPDRQSSLYNILTAGDSGTQMRTIYNMARDAANVGMNPLAARGYASALSRAGDTAINQNLSSNSGSGTADIPIYELLKRIAPGLAPSQ